MINPRSLFLVPGPLLCPPGTAVAQATSKPGPRLHWELALWCCLINIVRFSDKLRLGYLPRKKVNVHSDNIQSEPKLNPMQPVLQTKNQERVKRMPRLSLLLSVNDTDRSGRRRLYLDTGSWRRGYLLLSIRTFWTFERTLKSITARAHSVHFLC